MKKIIYFFAFCFLLSAFSLSAQKQITDSSFETGWKNEVGANGPYVEYHTDFFYTLNSLFAIENSQGPASITAYKDGNAQHGNSCIKLVSGYIAFGEDVFLPGMVGTLDEDFVAQYLEEGREVILSKDWYGYDTPRALEGWFKYHPVNGDSALIDIGFHDWSGEVFVEKMIIKERFNNWTFFRILVPEQYWDREFSEIRVLFVASAGVNFVEMMECKGQRGSTLWIDNISLNYTVDVKQNLLSTLKAKAFPNPAIDALNIELNELFTGKIMVYNSLGSLVMEENVSGTQCQLNTSTLATGNYIYKLMDGNTIFTQGKFVVVK